MYSYICTSTRRYESTIVESDDDYDDAASVSSRLSKATSSSTDTPVCSDDEDMYSYASSTRGFQTRVSSELTKNDDDYDEKDKYCYASSKRSYQSTTVQNEDDYYEDKKSEAVSAFYRLSGAFSTSSKGPFERDDEDKYSDASSTASFKTRVPARLDESDDDYDAFYRNNDAASVGSDDDDKDESQYGLYFSPCSSDEDEYPYNRYCGF